MTERALAESGEAYVAECGRIFRSLVMLLRHEPECTTCSAKKPTCISCGCDNDLDWWPDPFADEIGGDDAPVWMCEQCREESARDV